MRSLSSRRHPALCLAHLALAFAVSSFALSGCSSDGDAPAEGSGAAAPEISAEAGTNRWRTQVLERTEAQWAGLVDAAIAEALEPDPLQPLLLGGDPPLRRVGGVPFR